MSTQFNGEPRTGKKPRINKKEKGVHYKSKNLKKAKHKNKGNKQYDHMRRHEKVSKIKISGIFKCKDAKM